MRARAFFAVIIASVAGAPTASHAAGGFDGRWTITRTCPARDASGGTLTLVEGVVVDGVLTASRPSSGADDAALRLRGRVRQSGAAVFHEMVAAVARRTEDGGRLVGRSERRLVRAIFRPLKGVGREDGARPCELSFLRNGG